MFRMRQPFESEKLQLQELNQKLSQYLMRAKQLEQENTCLISEINSIRQTKSGEWENKHMSELREMRRLVERLSFEKCRAEMEREKLRNELQMLHAMRSEEASVSKSIDSEIKGCERQLHHALQTNTALEDRLIQLENEYKFLEDAHRKEIAHLRDQVHSRTVRVVTQTHRAPPQLTVTMEEVQEYAANFAESWQETLDMYRLKVEEIEESIKADQARLEDIQREKREYASQFKMLRGEIEQQTQVQLNLEEQLMNMQENSRAEINQYQVIIEDLEYERKLLSDTISEKLKDHQDLLRVKMGLALEVATYRALLEEEGRPTQMWSNQHSRERVIDMKMPAHPFAPRVSSTLAGQPDMKKCFTGYDMPISVSNRAPQSLRRDMISFTKAAQAAAANYPKEVSQHPLPRVESTSSSKVSQIAQPKPVKLVSPPMTLSKATIEESHQKDVEPKEKRMNAKAAGKEERQYVKVKESKAKDEREFESHQKDVEMRMDAKKDTDSSKATMIDETQHVKIKESKAKDERESKVFVGEEKVFDAVSVEEIIQQVMKPAGLDTRVLSSSPDSKVTYHVEKTEQDDGTTKTQIVLQSKVEEELDLSEDSALEELLSKGVKTVSLENIKGTPTGNVIENLLSLGLKGESLGNRSVNVEIIEEPVESQSDEESEIEMEETVEIKSQQPNIKTSSMFFQIEELESDSKTIKPNEGGSKTVEAIRDESLPYFSHGQDSQKYFVSNPEDNRSESEEDGRFMSYTHYGVVDDLSDERYYQEDKAKMSTTEGHSYRDSPEYGDHSFVRDSIQECIIEEEVHVSPTLQQSIVGMLTEESIDRKQQLRGALEQIQGTVTGALKEELAFLTKGGETPDSVSVDIKKVEQVTDNGTMTIVAELNVSQTLEDSELLEEEGDDPSEEQIMAALSSSNPGLQQALRGGAGIGYTINVSQEEFETEGMTWMTSDEEIGHWSSDEVSKMEKHIKLGPSEKSFTFQIDANSSSASASGGGSETEEKRGSGTTEFLQTQMIDPHLKVCHEKRIATVYLESPKDDQD
ncbi:synemin-like [Myxocyprinus asiaticus]|uniref:synemin-like n=1 Tax=Myxocyprinus asiaticus TaxID=70543 RepID=UPI0022230BB6|nr:synemin-like [Myxocyprinus asiaticus]